MLHAAILVCIALAVAICAGRALDSFIDLD